MQNANKFKQFSAMERASNCEIYNVDICLNATFMSLGSNLLLLTLMFSYCKLNIDLKFLENYPKISWSIEQLLCALHFFSQNLHVGTC